MSKTERLAAALLADRERPTIHHNIIPCFVCAYKFVYRGRQGELNGRLCSSGAKIGMMPATSPLTKKSSTAGAMVGQCEWG